MFNKKSCESKKIIGLSDDRVDNVTELTGYNVQDEINQLEVETGGLYFIPEYGVVRTEDVFDSSYGCGTRRMAKFEIVHSICSFKNGTVTTAYIYDHYAAGGHRVYSIKEAEQ